MTDLRLSLIIPVYNAMPYLTELLESVRAQSLSHDKFEVIAVNDGSTDGSGAELDRFAEKISQMQVIHQENWGWPGQPRNRALHRAQGRYVFFADSDDVFHPDAFEAMCDYADEHSSDIVVPQMGSINGRWVQPKMFTASRPDADLEVVFTTLGPTKLFRREFLRQHGLRFPEEKVRLEDGIMLSRAYFLAQRVSILTGEDYYQIRTRDDGQNISSRYLDPDGYTWSITQVSRNIRELDPDPQRARRIVLDLYRRKCLKFYSPARFVKLKEDRAQRFIALHQRFQDEFIPVALEETLNQPFRSRSEWVRAGDANAIRAGSQLAVTELSPVLRRWRLRLRGAELHVNAQVDPRTPATEYFSLEVTKRDSSWSYSLSPVWGPTRAATEGETVALVFQLGWRQLLAPTARILDFHLLRRVPYDSDRRKDLVQRARLSVAPGAEATFGDRTDVRPYTTANENFSVKLSIGRAGKLMGGVRALKRRIRR